MLQDGGVLREVRWEIKKDKIEREVEEKRIDHGEKREK